MLKLKAKRNRFVSMDNEFLTRKDLSLKAKGLLACMLCLPPDWRFSIEGLAYINKESESAISFVLRELEQFDYLRRSYPRTEDGNLQTPFIRFAIFQSWSTKHCMAKMMTT